MSAVTATVFNCRKKYEQRLDALVMDRVGTAIASIRDLEPAAARHGDYERLMKFRAALCRAVGEYEAGVLRGVKS